MGQICAIGRENTMNSPNYDSRTADKFVVRLPDGLRADIEAAANTGDRSMNSVFIQAVRQYLDGQNRQQILLDALANTVTTPMSVNTMHIDDRVRMAADARRYVWLRDTAYNTPRQDLVPRDNQGTMLVGAELDADIERAMTAYPGWAEVEQ